MQEDKIFFGGIVLRFIYSRFHPFGVESDLSFPSLSSSVARFSIIYEENKKGNSWWARNISRKNSRQRLLRGMLSLIIQWSSENTHHNPTVFSSSWSSLLTLDSTAFFSFKSFILEFNLSSLVSGLRRREKGQMQAIVWKVRRLIDTSHEKRDFAENYNLLFLPLNYEVTVNWL